MRVRTTLSSLLLAAFALAGCGEPPESPQHRALVSELRNADATVERLGAAVAVRAIRLASLQQQLDGERNRRAHFEQALRAYMLDNKLAVAAIALGLGGAGVALSDDSRISDEARAVGGVAGVLAAAYAIANADEVLAVFNELTKADSMLRAMQQREQELLASLSAEDGARVDDENRLTQANGRAAQLRTALSGSAV